MSKQFSSRAWAAREEDDPDEHTNNNHQREASNTNSSMLFASGSGSNPSVSSASGNNSPKHQSAPAAAAAAGAGSPTGTSATNSSGSNARVSSSLKIDLSSTLQQHDDDDHDVDGAAADQQDSSPNLLRQSSSVQQFAPSGSSSSSDGNSGTTPTGKQQPRSSSSSSVQGGTTGRAGASRISINTAAVAVSRSASASGKFHQPTSSSLLAMSSLPCSPVTVNAAGGGSSFNNKKHHKHTSSTSGVFATGEVAAAMGARGRSGEQQQQDPPSDKRHHHTRESSIQILDAASSGNPTPSPHHQQQQQQQQQQKQNQHLRSFSSDGAGQLVGPGLLRSGTSSPSPEHSGVSQHQQHLRQASQNVGVTSNQQQQQPSRPWRKVLYDRQEGYEDNYVDPSFMQQLNMNAELRKLKVGDMIRDTLVIVQQISIAVIFCFVYMSCQTRSVSLWQVAALDLSMFAFGVLITVVTQGRLGHLSLSAFKSITLATVVLSSTVFVAAPVFHTLTKNYADDTIYALSITLAFVHLVAGDYDFMNGSSIFHGTATPTTSAQPQQQQQPQLATSIAALTAAPNRSDQVGAARSDKQRSGGAASAASSSSSHSPASSAKPSAARSDSSPSSAAAAAAAGAKATNSAAAAAAAASSASSSSLISPSSKRKFNMEHNVSMNAAVVWTVLLASRLDDPRFTAVLLLFGIECFSLSPFVRRALREASVEVHSGFSLAVFGIALGCLIVTRVTLALGFVVAVIGVAVVLPVSFVRVQDGRFKSQIRGPWDEAVPRNSAAAQEWANTV